MRSRAGSCNPRLLTTLAAALLVVSTAAAQQPAARLQQLLVAEDTRGGIGGNQSIAVLLTGLASPDTLLRRVAVRAIGRLQRPEFDAQLIARLTDPVPAIRGEAANALAQSIRNVRATPNATDSGLVMLGRARSALLAALPSERDLYAAGAIAEALGRFPTTDSIAVRSIESAITARAAGRPSYNMVHAFYSMGGRRRLPFGFSAATISMLRSTATSATAADVRRLATLTLGGARMLDSATTVAAARDGDAQVRRLALAGLASLPAELRTTHLQRAFADLSPIVRIEGIGAARAGNSRPDCAMIIGAVTDPVPYVALTAIDALGASCANPMASITTLRHVIDGSLSTFGGPPDHRWQAGAHALRSLAKLDSAAAAPTLARDAASTMSQLRLAAATAAADARDLTVLRGLATDRDHNVREAAIAGLAKREKHEADDLYIDALASPGYQVVLAAATALAGSTDPKMLAAALDAFDRLSAPKIENARDPRIALLKRIADAGSSANASRLQPYLADFDTLVATTVATTLSKWTGTVVTAQANPLPIREEPLAETFMSRGLQLRVTMAASSGGGSFVVQLFPDETPATVARIVRLARAHFYDGHRFQRVEPNFVVQGGGPDASEYVGDQAFMRDELALHTQGIGTFGISARGSDTGDAQWYINIADNPRLDHEYTVFGVITSGLDVALNILEGDVIGRVEVLGGR